MRDVTLAILAGGAGTRMGGPKSSLQILGQPILEHLGRQFRWSGPTMLVLSPTMEPPAKTEQFGRVVRDPIAGIGPLRGVLTALELAETEIVVVATVDMPGICQEQLEWVVQRLIDRPETLGVMSKRLPEIVEPFPSAFRTSAKPIIEQQLSKCRRAMHGLLACDGFIAVEAPSNWPESTWLNLNTPDDLRAFIGRPL